MSLVELWHPGDKVEPHKPGREVFSSEAWKSITESIDRLDKELRELSLDISGMFTS